jgi:uncharacterized membrane protein YgcG
MMATRMTRMFEIRLAGLIGVLLLTHWGCPRAGEDGPAVEEQPDGGAAPAEQAEGEGKEEEAAPEPPHPGKLFRLDRLVFDTSGTLTPAELERIQRKAERFERETGYPLVVVVVRRLVETGPTSGTAVEAALSLLTQFTRRMAPELGKRAWIVLVATQDKRIRIQGGEGWGRDVTGPIQSIIDNVMIPHLRSKDDEGKPKKRDLAGAIVAGITEMIAVLYRYRAANRPVVSDSMDRFAARSWLWILLGLHLLGLLYVLCTKESEGWYVAGVFFGLPILFAMLIFVLQGEEDERAGPERATRVSPVGGGPPSEGERAMVWGYW